MNKSHETADALRSVHRAAALLRLLSTHMAAGWRLSDLAQAADLHHSTVHRLVKGLVEERLAARVAGSMRYTLGPMAHELGLAARPYFDLPAALADRLAGLAARTRDIVFLSVRSGADSVCIGRWEGQRALKAYTVSVGTRRALSLTAAGAAILVGLRRSERDAIIAANLQAITLRGDAQVAAVQRMLARSLRLGYGSNREDIIPGIAAVAVPFGPAGQPFGALSIGTSAASLGEGRRTKLLALLRQEAEVLAAAFAASRYVDVPREARITRRA